MKEDNLIQRYSDSDRINHWIVAIAFVLAALSGLAMFHPAFFALTGLFGGAIATHLRIGSPLFSHTLFGIYVGVMVWGGLWLRDERVRQVMPFMRQD